MNSQHYLTLSEFTLLAGQRSNHEPPDRNTVAYWVREGWVRVVEVKAGKRSWYSYDIRDVPLAAEIWRLMKQGFKPKSAHELALMKRKTLLVMFGAESAESRANALMMLQANRDVLEVRTLFGKFDIMALAAVPQEKQVPDFVRDLAGRLQGWGAIKIFELEGDMPKKDSAGIENKGRSKGILATILVGTNLQNSEAILQRIISFPEVKRGFITSGEWDIVIDVEVDDLDRLGNVILRKLRDAGAVKTYTLIAIPKTIQSK